MDFNAFHETPESEAQNQPLPEKALRMARKMDPEQLCRFLKVLDNLGVEGVSEEELLDVRNTIRRIILNKISDVPDLADWRRPSKAKKVRGKIAQVLQFPMKPEPKPKRVKMPKKPPRPHLYLVK